MSEEQFVIVGGGHAAGTLAPLLRREGWQGGIVLVSDEDCLPYHRPPLSKTYLTEGTPDEQLLLRTPQDYQKNEIEVCLNTSVLSIDRQQSVVHLRTQAGEASQLHYDRLALCTGARPRRLQIPGADLDGVFYLRSLADAAAIRRAAKGAQRAVIVGGGYIGLEIAASLRKVGLEVQVLEAMDRLLQRVTSAEMSAFFARLHTGQGVRVQTGAQVTAFTGDGCVDGVLANGERLEADLVVVGIGVIPEVQLAEAAGLTIDNGIVVNDNGLTEDERIWALGDCCSFPCSHYDRRLRLESIPNATGQARRAAVLACGGQPPVLDLPWFWSDQYDIKLQIAGINAGFERVVLRGDPDGQSFSAWYLVGETPIAADCINRPQDFVAARKLIAERIVLSEAVLSDPDSDLRKIAAGQA